MRDYYQLSADEVFKVFNSGKKGLSHEEAEKRQKIHGRNELPRESSFRALGFLLRQFKSPLVYILIIAGIISFAIGEFLNTVIIFAAVCINVLIGFYQEFSSDQILKKLSEKIKVLALVKRSGEFKEVEAGNLVPGDVITIKSGMKVPADARIFETKNLTVNEAFLTGESEVVNKSSENISGELPVADRKNMIFMGSPVEQGSAEAVVVKTGKDTEIGQIASLAKESESRYTPLQERIARLGKFLSILVLVAAFLIAGIGMAQGIGAYQIFVLAVAVSVAAIPEGLPAAIAVVLAVAGKNIYKKNGLVKNLMAAESLGSVSALLIDKTGTLTEGKMKLEKIIPAEKSEKVLTAIALANEAIIERDGDKTSIRGEATDKAKLESYLEAGYDMASVLSKFPRINVLPFDFSRKFIASFHGDINDGKSVHVFVAGAPEAILAVCQDFPKKNEMKSEIENLALKGYRVIAAAEEILPLETSEISKKSEKELTELLNHLTFLGLAVLSDPIRKDVREAIKEVRAAGIKIILFTGDHRLTAVAIGKELGFKTGGMNILEGIELDNISDEKLKERISEIEIYARVDPKHKLRITKAWKDMGESVAVTGDGINDAPSLEYADVGVALNSGTDITKEAGDLVLIEDSLSTIVSAIRYGRSAFDNMRKVATFLFFGSFAEIILVLSSLVLRIPLPITAVQILWTNLVTDGFPNFALSFEPSDENVMRRAPQKRSGEILDKKSRAITFSAGIAVDLLLFFIFFLFYKFSGLSIEYIRTIIFAALGTDTLFAVFSLKSLSKPLFKLNLFDNIYLLTAVALGFIMMLVALYSPLLNYALKTVPLKAEHFLLVILLGVLKVFVIEAVKWFYNRSGKYGVARTS